MADRPWPTTSEWSKSIFDRIDLSEITWADYSEIQRDRLRINMTYVPPPPPRRPYIHVHCFKTSPVTSLIYTRSMALRFDMYAPIVTMRQELSPCIQEVHGETLTEAVHPTCCLCPSKCLSEPPGVASAGPAKKLEGPGPGGISSGPTEPSIHPTASAQSGPSARDNTNCFPEITGPTARAHLTQPLYATGRVNQTYLTFNQQ